MTAAGFIRVFRTIPLMLIVVFFCPFAYGKVIHVDDDGHSDFDNIQAGIDATDDGDTVLVAPGTYTGQGNRDINFRGKAITVRGTDPNDPAIIASTIIDCQEQGRGFIFESGEQTDSIVEGITVTHGKRGGIHISNSSPTITKCTISNNLGGGIYCDRGSPMIVDSIIENNTTFGFTEIHGGGISCYSSDNPSIINCTIRGNSTNKRGDGGGIYIHGYGSGGQPIISNCSIIGNTGSSGGGLYIHECDPLISHCTIANNYAVGGGGLSIGGMGWPDAYAIRLEHCRITGNSANSQAGGLIAILCNLHMSNCVISGNRLYGGGGGGLSIKVWTIAEINQCTIVGNKVVEDPPGVNCVGGGLYLQMCDVKIANSIIRRNRATKGAQLAIHAWDGQQSPDEPPINDPTLVTLHHNDFNSEQDQEVYIYGEPNLLTLETYDNLDTDPCFANPGFWDPNGTPDDPNDDFWIDGDYHLKSQDGRWDPNSQSWIQDDVTSPCIDAGDPNSPIGHEPFPNGGIINMGAYGGTQEASKSYILAKIIYVDDDAVGNNDGSSWQNAYTFLQDALADANSAEKPVEIRVAQGIYQPDKGVYQMDGDRVATFQLTNGVNLKGGYAGFGASDSNGRDIKLYQTILSGDLNGNDLYIADPCDLYDEPTRADNSYSVVTALEADETTVLDSFTVTGGNANGPISYGEYPDEFRFRCGGGMYNWESSPILNNCTFSVNAASNGGGLYNYGGSPTLTNCIFKSNFATGRGGGMENSWNSWYQEQCNPTLIECTFTANKAYNGGGVFNETSSPWINNCVFIGNFARRSGGGMCNVYESNPTINFSRFIANSVIYYGGGLNNHESSPMLYNCTIIGNKTSMTWSQGGGIMNWEISSPTLVNCTLSDNYAYRGGGIHNVRNDCAPELMNCIVWGNIEGDQFVEPAQIRDGTPIINYCCVQDWEESLGGEGNTNIDPCFVETGYWTQSTPRYPSVWIDGDYHLKSQAGRWDPNSQSWIQDDVTSPCIDTGDPNSPIGHEPFPNGGIINMGAYGGTEQASMSL